MDEILAFLNQIFIWVCVLSRFTRELILPEAIIFELVTEFFHIKSKWQKEKLRFYVAFASYQKALESKILLEMTLNNVNLYGSVPAKKYPLICSYVFKRTRAGPDKFWRYLDLHESSRLSVTFTSIRTTLTVSVMVISCFNLIFLPPFLRDT